MPQELKDKFIGETLLGKYRIESLLGSGGTSTVYLGVEESTGAEFAVKILRSHFNENYVVLMRFQREIQAAKRFRHPNIVSIHENGTTESGDHYMIIDIIRGVSLAEILEDEINLPVERAIPIFTQIISALSHAHASGIVHRDLKPANVMISQEPQPDTVKLVDFGIAKVRPTKGKRVQKLTAAGEILGTCLYLSPEQCAGGAADTRSDIYALGCLMYEVLSGLPPFVGFSVYETIQMHQQETPTPLASLSEDLVILDGISDIVSRCLAKKANARYQTMDEVHDALLKFAGAEKN